jgi:hypothetical protein
MARAVRRFCIATSFAITTGQLVAGNQDKVTGPCATALAQGAVCEAANERALEIMKAGNLDAITVVQDGRTGALIAFAASDPAKLDITTAVLPLSTVKLMVAASWWDHGQPDEPKFGDSPPMSVTEMRLRRR